MVLEQIWNLEGNRGVKIYSEGAVSILAGKSIFIPPKEWIRVYLPYKLIIEGGVTIACGLQRRGLIAGLAITKGGQIRVNIWNSTQEVIQLAPKTVLVNVLGAEVTVKYLGENAEKIQKEDVYEIDEREELKEKDRKEKIMGIGIGELSPEFPFSAEKIEEKIREMFPNVGDLSSHPVNERMEELIVKKEEVNWSEPQEFGVRTQYAIENVADRRLIDKQLDEYVQRGYLREVSVAEVVYLSPLLPIKKPNGTFRFTNDFRKLNKYFKNIGTTQVDVWRKLWELNPNWKYYMKIDLKDGFFGIPVDETLSRLFGFTYGSRRFVWRRLPQGWLWSPIFFGERVAEILKGLDTPQYSDDVLVGAESPKELFEKAVEVFRRFNEFGVKVNYDKVVWVSNKLTFLGYEIEDGTLSLKKYIKKKMENVGKVSNIKDLERVIGIISYARRTIQKTEEVLAPLRQDLKILKKGNVSEQWFEELNSKVLNAFNSAFENMKDLMLPGCIPNEFILETDWSGNFSGYMLFATLANEKKALIDLGSRTNTRITSSYLGELDAIIWACKKTKAFRGSIPLIIRTDSHSIFDKYQSKILVDDDVRSFRRWGWLLANEPGFNIEFYPGSENSGADLLSRPHPKKLNIGDMVVTEKGIEKVMKKKEIPQCFILWGNEGDVLKVKKLREDAELPERKTPGAVGYDLFSYEEKILKGNERILIGTGIAIELPKGVYGRIAPRSGLALKQGINLGAGVIDPDYRGELKILLFNHSDTEYVIKKGERIAQLIMEKVKIGDVEEVEKLSDTRRSDKGFGSTNLVRKTEEEKIVTEGDLKQLVWQEHLKAHWGPKKVYWALQKNGTPVKMEIVKEVCSECEICAKFRPERPRSKWHSVLYSEEPGEVIYADVIGPLPTGRGGFKYIHCIVESLTKMSKTKILKVVDSVKVIEAFESWMKDYGSIKTLVTDNASYYSSEMMSKWCKEKGIIHRFSAPYRHQSMGIVERYNRTLEDRIRKLKYAHGGSWVDYVSMAEKSINSIVHDSTGYSPIELWNGNPEMIKEVVLKRDKERERRNQKRQIFPVKFYIGQMVLVREYNPQKQGKFDRLWKGPYEVIKKVSKTMWKVKRSSRDIAIYHEDQMQPFDL